MLSEDLTTLDGVGEATAKKLRDEGIDTVLTLASTTVMRLRAAGIRKNQ